MKKEKFVSVYDTAKIIFKQWSYILHI